MHEVYCVVNQSGDTPFCATLRTPQHSPKPQQQRNWMRSNRMKVSTISQIECLNKIATWPAFTPQFVIEWNHVNLYYRKLDAEQKQEMSTRKTEALENKDIVVPGSIIVNLTYRISNGQSCCYVIAVMYLGKFSLSRLRPLACILQCLPTLS